MAGRKLHIVAYDAHTGEVVWHCAGPDARGACRRTGVHIGDEVPCIGRLLTIVGSDGEPYEVPVQMTLCPVTLAAALDAPMLHPAGDRERVAV